MVILGTVGPHLHVLHTTSSILLCATAESRSHHRHGQHPSRLDLDPQNHLPANHAPIQTSTVHKEAQISPVSHALIYACVFCCSVAKSHPTLCNPMNCSTSGFPVHHQLPEFTQTQVHQVSDAIQPSHPLSSPSPPAPNPFQHQSLFQ